MKLPLSAFLAFGLAASSLSPTALSGAIVMASQDTDFYRFLNIPSSSTGDLDIASEFANPHTFRSFIEFDIASLGYTVGQPVTSAQLWLYSSAVTAGGTIRVQDITSDWSVGGFTWDTQPTVGSFLTDATVSTAGTWYSFDITSLVQQWVNDPTSNYGIRLMAPDTAQLKFISNDATTGNTEYRPYIAVTPEPGRSLLLAAALGTVTFRRRRMRTAWPANNDHPSDRKLTSPTMKPFSAPTRLHHGFTLMELLVVTAIIAALSALAFGAFNAATTHARKAAEIGAAKSLVSAYLLYPSDNNGELMVAHYEGSSRDLDARDYTLPDGTTLGSAELHRYPFRLAPYMQDKIEGTLLVNRNKDQIQEAFPGGQFHYGTSLCPALGINYYYVGGYKADNEIAGATDCATNLMQVSKPGSLLVFASAFTQVGDKRIEGRYGVEPPYFRSKLWDSSLHVDARYNGKAVTAFMDGSVRLMSIDELRDMRYWSVRAAEADNANYTVPPVASTGVGGGNTGGGRGGRR